MQFSQVAAILFFTAASAAPVTNPTTIPDECEMTTSNSMVCNYTSPHPGAYPVVTSSSKDSCTVDEEDPHNMTCHLPGPPSFASRSVTSTRSVSASGERRDVDAEAYKFSLVCDDDGCETNGLKARDGDDDFDAEAYSFSVTIEWKRDLEGLESAAAGAFVKRDGGDDLEAEAYSFSVTIAW
ncbi:hypothetical protein MKZ38_003358 [Zalerion maritima]|uniref:Uncharacterized protein n=1 Tax=Zalerion maritima TaxID=339359 RepID=A0AAD5WRU7_9PEZI|nr:hypothetical protein MKZ38_003358 [Zalerion maritima]